MTRKSLFINCLLLAVLFVSVAGAFTAITLYKVKADTVLPIVGLVVLATIFIMAMVNYRISAYGGRFKTRYPNSKASMTDPASHKQ